MNFLTFYFYKNDKEEYNKFEIHNELRDLIKSSNSFNYYHIYNFYIEYKEYISILDLFQNMIIHGNMDGLEYLTKTFYGTQYLSNGIQLFVPFYSYLLNSVKNIDNIQMYQYIFEHFNYIKPTFYDFILTIQYGNIDILYFFMNNFLIPYPTDNEIKNFDIKEFLEKVKEKKDVTYIKVVFDIIQSSTFLQTKIINYIGKNVDFNFISKKYFIESIMKSMIDNHDLHPFTRNISYSYNA